MKRRSVFAGNKVRFTKGIMAIAAASLMASLAIAGEEPSMELGKKLFESPALGSNGKTCATCHQGGKGLQNAASYDAVELGDIVNRCVEGALGGEGLDAESNDLKSLVIYIKSFAKSDNTSNE